MSMKKDGEKPDTDKYIFARKERESKNSSCAWEED